MQPQARFVERFAVLLDGFTVLLNGPRIVLRYQAFPCIAKGWKCNHLLATASTDSRSLLCPENNVLEFLKYPLVGGIQIDEIVLLADQSPGSVLESYSRKSQLLL
jgi:hypothetical protein